VYLYKFWEGVLLLLPVTKVFSMDMPIEPESRVITDLHSEAPGNDIVADENS
jgi:hypothetical protein